MEKKLRNLSGRNSVRGLLTLLLLAFFGPQFGFSQSPQSQTFESSPSFNPTAEAGPGIVANYPGQSAQTPALWDIQFSFNLGDTLGVGGIAGAVWTGTEFWVSIWSNDTLYSVDQNGSLISKFVVPGLSGTRSLTTDGTNIYAGNASTTVTIINPATKLATGSITVPVAARHCAYDATLNSGAGGLWVGNWGTDIVGVSLSGTTLATITAATHGLTGMYGSAIDNQTAGGPYLWVFDQSTSASSSDIVRLQLPGGMPTLVSHDVMSDIGLGSTSGLAGGLFITNGLVSGQWTIGGMLQSSPNNMLFGYELNDFVQPAVDAEMTSASHDLGFTQIPLDHAGALVFNGEITNKGTDALAAYDFITEVFSGATQVSISTISGTNLASGATVPMSSSSFALSSTGVYDVLLYVNVTGTQVDTVIGNDTIYYTLEITDSTFARDNGISSGNGYTVSTTSSGLAATSYTLAVADTLSSIYIRLENPVPNDTTYGVVYSISGGLPFQLIAQGNNHIISGSSNDIVLEFPNGVPLAAGEYVFGCYEGFNTGISLSQSSSVYTQGTNFYWTPANGWSNSNIQTARFIRPNFGIPFGVSVDPDKDISGSVVFFPNPTNGMLHLQFKLEEPGLADIQISNTIGQLLKEIKGEYVHQGLSHLDLSDLPAGMYLIKVETEQGSVSQRINVMN